jgi:O-antigen ligase
MADGFSTPETATLRAPHNAHMDVLARTGVPGLVLWITTLVAIVATLLWNMVVANRRSDEQWANLFLFIACYLISIIIDASFDVALEGPMLGIWFWALVGFGLGSTMLYRAGRRADGSRG